MIKHLSARLRPVGILLAAIGAATVLAAAARAHTASQVRASAPGTLVALRKTALGSVLVDARGRTLYLFEKDQNGVSKCSRACAVYWPPLTSHAAPRAGKGVHQSLLRLGRAHGGARLVLYAGHPLYTFVGDKRAGQTSGEGLANFGAEWYAVSAGGKTVERGTGTSRSSGSTGGGYGYGG